MKYRLYPMVEIRNSKLTKTFKKEKEAWKYQDKMYDNKKIDGIFCWQRHKKGITLIPMIAIREHILTKEFKTEKEADRYYNKVINKIDGDFIYEKIGKCSKCKKEKILILMGKCLECLKKMKNKGIKRFCEDLG